MRDAQTTELVMKEDISQLYAHFRTLEEYYTNEEDFHDDLDCIRWGIHFLGLSIHDIIDKRQIKIDEKNRTVTFRHYETAKQVKVSLDTYDLEIESREDLMRNRILELSEEIELTQPRVT